MIILVNVTTLLMNLNQQAEASSIRFDQQPLAIHREPVALSNKSPAKSEETGPNLGGQVKANFVADETKNSKLANSAETNALVSGLGQ